MKVIPDLENYLITEDGETIYSLYTDQNLSLTVDNSTYKRVNLYVDGKTKKFLVHRLVAITYIPNPENLPQVNHKDGNKLNNNVSNLEWVTAGDNQRHAYDNNLKHIPSGEFNGRKILSEEDVVCIYNKLLEGKVSNRDLAREYDVGFTTILSIKTKSSWGYLLESFPDVPLQSKSDKLSEEDVNMICQLYADGYKPSEVQRMLKHFVSVTKNQLSDIKRRRTFKSISSKYEW